MYHQMLAICAGFCAAMASTCGKLAMSSTESVSKCLSLSRNMPELFHWLSSLDMSSGSDKDFCENISSAIRIFLFGCIFLFNAVMWTLFVKSLRLFSSSVAATVTNTASNFFFTAVLGKVLFAESLTLMWWAGASFIVLGLMLIHHANQDVKKKES